MALVAYDNSDSSEFEDDENDGDITSNKKDDNTDACCSNQPISSHTQSNGETASGHKLFNLLPSTTKKTAIIEEEDDEFLHKKEIASNIKPKAKITVPSLNDFKDVEDRPLTARPKASNGKKSGLLSMLPQPKNAAKSTTSLIPNSLKRKAPAPLIPTSIKIKPLPAVTKKLKAENQGLTTYSDESDNDEEETTDFFSINKPADLPPVVNLAPDVDLGLLDTPVTVKTEKIEIEVDIPVPEPENTEFQDYKPKLEHDSKGYSDVPVAESSGSNGATLDDEALRQLIGSRAKRKREDIQIVDVDQKEVLGDSREWLLKGLMDDTTKRVSSSKKTGNEPSAQQRRKHQITYLAHQAKANEAELQNQWANSRMSKRKTQSKYGF